MVVYLYSKQLNNMPNLKNVRTADGSEETKVEILYVTELENVSKTEGKDFFKQSVGIKETKELNGSFYTKYFELQATNDTCKSLTDVNVGDEVDVKYEIKGSTFKKKDTIAVTPKNPEHIGIMTNFNIVELTVFKKAEKKYDLKNKNVPIPNHTWNDFLNEWERNKF
jgi:hypothetical protein